MKHSITGKITSASRRFLSTILLEHKCSLEPWIKAAIEGRNGGRPCSRKTRSDCAWKPQLGCRGAEIDRKMGLWEPVIHMNGALVSIFSWSLRVIFWNWHLSDSSLGQRTLFLVVELAGQIEQVLTPCSMENRGWHERSFFPSKVLTAFYFYIFVNKMLY